jgi:hypothetical protein
METKHFCNQKQFVTAYDAIRHRYPGRTVIKEEMA